MKSLLQLLVLSAALLALWGCNENVGETPGKCDLSYDDPENLADFTYSTVIPSVHFDLEIEEPDSIFAKGLQCFNAKYPADRYKIIFGDDSIYSENSQICIDFSNQFSYLREGGEIDVTLIAFRDAKDCYPNSKTDTMTKTYYFWNHKEYEDRKKRLTGRYEYMDLNNNSDYGYCHIRDSLYPPSYRQKRFYISGFPKNCNQPMQIGIFHEYIRFATDVQSECRGDGFAKTRGQGKNLIVKFYKAHYYRVEDELEVQLEEKNYLLRKTN